MQIRDYIIKDSAITKRFNRDFLNNEINKEYIKRIDIYDGFLPKMLSERLFKYGGYIKLSKIQNKEEVFYSEKKRTLAVACYAGRARKNHLIWLIKRFMRINGMRYKISVLNNGGKSQEQIAKEWISRLPRPIPTKIIFGSLQGISTLLHSYDLPSEIITNKNDFSYFINYYNARFIEYSSEQHIKSLFGKFDRKSAFDLVESLRKDPLFLVDSKILWAIRKRKDIFERGFPKSLNYIRDEYLDYAYLKIKGKRFLVTGYPYGDQMDTVLKMLRKKSRITAVYFIGSCGSLKKNIKLNDLIVPNAISYKGRTLSFKNDLKELIGRKFCYGPLKLFCFDGKSKVVDSPLTEMVTQLESFAKEGFVSVDVEAYHLISASKGIPKIGVIYYISDMPLHGSNLTNSPPSYVGWKTAATNLIKII